MKMNQLEEILSEKEIANTYFVLLRAETQRKENIVQHNNICSFYKKQNYEYFDFFLAASAFIRRTSPIDM